MKDEYTSAFHDIVKEASETTGFQLPLEIESYVVMLLADKIDKPNFLPKTTFAEELLQIQNHRLRGKELGDSALFQIATSSKVPLRYCGPLGRFTYGFSTPKNIGSS